MWEMGACYAPNKCFKSGEQMSPLNQHSRVWSPSTNSAVESVPRHRVLWMQWQPDILEKRLYHTTRNEYCRSSSYSSTKQLETICQDDYPSGKGIKLQELPDVGSKAVLILGDSEWHYGPIVKARVYRSDKCTLGSATLHSGPGGALDLFCGYFSNSKLQS